MKPIKTQIEEIEREIESYKEYLEEEEHYRIHIGI